MLLDPLELEEGRIVSMETCMAWDNAAFRPALFSPGLPSGEEVGELVRVLMGEDPQKSAEVLRPAVSGTVPADMGAETTMYLAFGTPPPKGIDGVYNWVRAALSPAMPEGWGAAVTQPILFPTRTAEGQVVYLVVISPMKKSSTMPVIGMAIADYGPVLVSVA